MPKRQSWDIPRLDSLIENAVPEDRLLDFKSALVLGDPDKKRDFVKDVASFANSIGGTLLFGVKEEALVAKELVGIPIDNKDSLVRHLDDLLRTGTQPYVQGPAHGSEGATGILGSRCRFKLSDGCVPNSGCISGRRDHHRPRTQL